jgi:anti-sigma regulatory factor (Ser/Thr protein kinase)
VWSAGDACDTGVCVTRGGLAVRDQAADRGLRHSASLYHAPSEYLAVVSEFVQPALIHGEPVFVVVPDPHALTDWLSGAPDATVADMRQLGRNPARLISALRGFADRYPRRRVRYLAEPAWAGRSGAELREIAKYESLLNQAFADADVTALCLYNAAELSGAVIADACRGHPTVRHAGRDDANADYRGPAAAPDSLTTPLLAPPTARVLSYDGDLRSVRALVADVTGQAGLSPGRSTDLVIAASEVAANTLRHTSGGGVVRLWATDAEVLCQFEDTGHITDPLAGHWRSGSDMAGGQGLWLVNQVCDLAEIRSSERGTTIRLHMYRR